MAEAGASYLQDVVRTYRMYKSLGDRALAQLPADADLNRLIDPESNSIAIIVKHVAGNLRSRFRDFLTTDGEKPDRRRDDEFGIAGPVSRAAVVAWWDEGWSVVTAAIEALTPDDLTRTIRIRDKNLLVVEALNRSITHTAYHVGQIVFLARHMVGAGWKSLSIPKGESEIFNASMRSEDVRK
jgi:hypothetical protein